MKMQHPSSACSPFLPALLIALSILLPSSSFALEPRLDDVMIKEATFHGDEDVDVTLVLAGANFDEKLTVTLTGNGVPEEHLPDQLTDRVAVLDNRHYMHAKDPATLGYPISSYAAHEFQAKGLNSEWPITVTVKNQDGKTSKPFKFELPEEAEALDSDGDGLWDIWEKEGYDADGDKKPDVRLQDMGVHPLRKDLFVEVDWMPLTHGKPRPDLWHAVEHTFKQAPVFNPDGSHGIDIHIDHGQKGFDGTSNGKGGAMELPGALYWHSIGTTTGGKFGRTINDRQGDYIFNKQEAAKWCGARGGNSPPKR